jgi:sulfur-oxidizing protein SoxY
MGFELTFLAAEGVQQMNRRRLVMSFLWVALAASVQAASPGTVDPYDSGPWVDMRREYLGKGAVVFDERVRVQGPSFAEDPMNVPISVTVDPALGPVQRIVVMVDRNPIRRVLAYEPMQALPSLAFRFKLEQASPVRAAALTKDGVWHVGGTWVDSSGGGCTAPGATRKDGSWSQTLGDVSGRLYSSAPDAGKSSSRLRFKVMHPMDTGLVGGIPAFYVNRLSVRDGNDRELARLQTWEPVSENPVFSFDFSTPPTGGVRVVGTDNNGNRIASRVE